MLRLLILLCALMLPLSATAQQESTLIEELAEQFSPRTPTATPTSPEPATGPTLPQGYRPSADTLAAADISVQAYYKHQTAQFDHRLSVFEWQYLSSQIIFYVVILIVLIGLYFSWMQFHHALKNGEMLGTSELSASKEGFSVSSPVLGVIILILSLVFFYLYLTHVYPISEV